MWTIVNDFHIEKIRLPVVVVTTAGERLAGDLFAQANPRLPSGHEDVPDLLNGPEPYFPLGTAGRRTLLCAKSRVREVHFTIDAVDVTAWTLGTPVSVCVGLDDGSTVAGTLLVEVDAAGQRVLDFLNRFPNRFLPVHTSSDVVLINRDHIVHVEQVS
ncbi:MAG: hypothetical protein H7066_00265 [Cytophagaceae bacterium]|nr:hypothetical protein [Gemmatimonadaceae bacterium]